MVERNKRKAEDAVATPTSNKRTPVKKKSPGRPVVSQSGKLYTCQRYSHRASSDRARALIPALKFLLPSMKKWQNLPSNMKIKEAREVLRTLTDCPQIIAMADDDKELDNRAFLAAVLDYAQESAGIPMNPRASEVALVADDYDLVDIHSGKLIELGLYHERWPVPLTAEGIKKKNRPRDGASDLERGMSSQLPENRTQGVSSVKKPEKAGEGSNIRKPKPENLEKTLAAAVEKSGPAVQKGGPPVTTAIPPPVPAPSKVAAVSGSGLLPDGKLTCRLTGTKFQHYLNRLVRGLSILLPQARDSLDAIRNLKKDPALEELEDLLGNEAPSARALGKDLTPEDYIRQVLEWALKAVGGGDGAVVAERAIKIEEFQAEFVPEVWKQAGKIESIAKLYILVDISFVFDINWARGGGGFYILQLFLFLDLDHP